MAEYYHESAVSPKCKVSFVEMLEGQLAAPCALMFHRPCAWYNNAEQTRSHGEEGGPKNLTSSCRTKTFFCRHLVSDYFPSKTSYLSKR